MPVAEIPSLGTSTSDKLANVNTKGAMTHSTYNLVDQNGNS